MSVERLYVEEPVYDEFLRRFTDEVKTLKQGTDGREYGMDQGAMTFPPRPRSSRSTSPTPARAAPPSSPAASASRRATATGTRRP